MSFEGALALLPAELREALHRAGLADPAVLVEACASGGSLSRLLLPGLRPPDEEALDVCLRELAARAAPAARTRIRVLAAADCGAVALAAKRRKEAQAHAGWLGSVARLAELPGGRARSEREPAPLALPAVLRRIAPPGGPATAREVAEGAKRAEAVASLAEIVREARLPAAVRGALYVGQGRRAGTLRTRLRTWRKVRAWLLVTHGSPWPTGVAAMVSYLEHLAEEPCPRSRVDAVAAALAFVEKAGGLQPSQAISADPLFLGAVAEIKLNLGSGGGRTRGPARRNFVMTLVARELLVMRRSAAPVARAYAWWQLVKSYGTLRFDDHRGLVVENLRLTPRGLEAFLVRSKTSGPGQRRETLPLFVSAEAFVAAPGWLEVGYSLWEKYASFSRDFFLPVPEADLEGFTSHELRYADALRLSSVVNGMLTVPFWREGRWRPSAVPLFASALLPCWSEHSERSDMPSWGAALGYTREILDDLGNWRADGSEVYVRTKRIRVERLQRYVCEKVRGAWAGPDLLDEADLASRLQEQLVRDGSSREAAERALRPFLYFGVMAHSFWAGSPPPAEFACLGFTAAGAGEGSGQEGLLAVTDEGVTPVEEGRSLVPLCDEPAPPSSPEFASLAPSEEEADFGGTDDAAPSGPEGPPDTEPEVVDQLELERAGLSSVDLASLARTRGWGRDAPLSAEASGFVLNTAAKRMRRLHILIEGRSKCGRVPGVDFFQFVVFESGLPGPEWGAVACRACWRGGGPTLEAGSTGPAPGSPSGPSSASSGGSTSSSSSTGPPGT